eukprot:CAMPEP_0170496374 /NCGR_PEP_ID=MMETSP0208-20121228/21250_1 /TAXON_ID=197538 /ORGANISM="Strombidium inclinatum, Strain S3" /LENGTH=297 /DNA_ID=CAMNT_0010772895 /DNA_START=258 /DNA_END=1151 /DNA_ORIENTATION=+
MYVMREEGVPFVVNYPMPLGMESPFFRTHEQDNLTVCCGLACWKESLSTFLMYMAFKLFFMPNEKEFIMQRDIFYQNTKLVNSFWGLDDKMITDPSWIMTGSLSSPKDGLVEALREKDEKLYLWLEESLQIGKPVVYLALGSVSFWAKWSVEAVYSAMKELGVRVIWGMSGTLDMLPVKDDPDVWARDWLPQQEILAHPAIKAGLSHCGYGSINEFISSGIPIVSFPHSNDQGPNAELIAKQKIAVNLIPPQKAYNTMDPKGHTYKDPIFTKADAVKVFKEILENKEYKTNIMKLRK